MSIDLLKDRLPEYARDLKLNLSSLASEQLLSPQQKAGSFIAAALAANHAPTTQAVVDAFGPELSPEALNAAKIAASLMAMNNIYYRFVHLVHAADYKTLPAKLRMTAMAKPGVDKVDFELWSLVVSAINGCGMCLEAHEKVCRDHGLSAEQIQAAVRIAATVHAVARTLSAEEALAVPLAKAGGLTHSLRSLSGSMIEQVRPDRTPGTARQYGRGDRMRNRHLRCQRAKPAR